MLMCGFKFHLSLIVLEAELLDAVRFVGLDKIQDPKMILVMFFKTVMPNQEVILLCFWTFLTAFALLVFFIYIMGKYIRDLTVNEEAKYDKTRNDLLALSSRMSFAMKSKKEVTQKNLDQLTRDFEKINLWFTFWEQKYSNQKLIGNALKLLLC